MRGQLAHTSAFWRRLAYAGARYGPRLWLRVSPPVIAVVFALVLGRARRQIRSNLRWAGGPGGFWREQWAVLVTFCRYAQCFAESLAGARPEARAAKVRLLGEEHFAQAVRGGRGAVILTAHLGPWDAAARLLSEVAASSVLVVMEPERDAGARALHDELRRAGGVRVVHVGEHPLDALPLLHHLRQGGLLAIQLDRGAPSQRLLQVELFGQSYALPEGPFRLAALAGVALVPVFARRLGFFDYELVVSPPMTLERRADRASLERVAQVAVDAMALAVRRAPTQWFQFG